LAARKRGIPIILDPVGVGASTYRRESFDRLVRFATAMPISKTATTVIKGNAGEISALADHLSRSRGVDAISCPEHSARSSAAMLRMVQGVAVKYRKNVLLHLLSVLSNRRLL